MTGRGARTALRQDRLLLTGFEPFGGDTRNPSGELAQALDGDCIGELQVVGLRLPCAFEAAPQVLEAALQRWQPRMVLALGQAGGRDGLSLERIAINLIDAPIADNAGQRPNDTPVAADGPAAYFSDLPVKAMLAAVRAAGVPAGVSLSAGSFVCNQVFYWLLHRLAGQRPAVPAGFMHLPLLPEQAAARGAADGLATLPPSLPLATMSRGLRAALGAAVQALQPGGAGQPCEPRFTDTGRLH